MRRAVWIVAIGIVALLAWQGYRAFYQDSGGPAGGPDGGPDGGPADKSSTANRDRRAGTLPSDAELSQQRSRGPVSGVVYGPDEKPLVGARVSLHRMVSDWPRPQLE